MAVTAHTYPKFLLGLGNGTMKLGTDTLKVGLASGTYAWNATSQGHQSVADFLAGSGSGALTEVSTSGTGYGRQALTTVTWSASGLTVTLGCANPQWTSSTITADYAFFYDDGPDGVAASADSGRLLICYWDLGGAVSDTNGTFELQVNASGLFQDTAS